MAFTAQYVERCRGNDNWLGDRFHTRLVLSLSTHYIAKITMPQSKDRYPLPGSDESLALLLLSNQSLYPGSDCEAMMLQEALATTTDTESLTETKPSSRRIIGLEIVASLLLIGIGLLVQLSHKTDIVTPTLELETAENVDQIQTTKNLGALNQGKVKEINVD